MEKSFLIILKSFLGVGREALCSPLPRRWKVGGRVPEPQWEVEATGLTLCLCSVPTWGPAFSLLPVPDPLWLGFARAPPWLAGERAGAPNCLPDLLQLPQGLRTPAAGRMGPSAQARSESL